MGWTGRATERCLLPDGRLPLIIQPTGNHREQLAQFAGEYRQQIDDRLIEHGALLFRGFDMPTSSAFSAFVDGVSKQRLDYVYRSTPRTTVEKKVFTATGYPAELEIPQHNENAFQRDWPMRVAFYCAIPAAKGGETPIADMRRVTATIGEKILDRFEEDRIKYVRNYSPGVDLPWETVFQTNDRAEVARYCEAEGIAFEWIGSSALRTSQVCQGVARHPVTNERLFFNQAHLFHVSSLGSEMAESMLEVFGPDGLPRNSFFGNGRVIDDGDLTHVRNAFAAEAIAFPWQAGDVLLLDNMQVSHGRRPYSGKREVLVSLSDPYSAASTGRA
jgi:alpha-ketoglutarate-dependent taurine dioxygenase